MLANVRAGHLGQDTNQSELQLNAVQLLSIEDYKQAYPKTKHYPNEAVLKLIVAASQQELNKPAQPITDKDDITIVREALRPGAKRSASDLQRAADSFEILVNILMRGK